MIVYHAASFRMSDLDGLLHSVLIPSIPPNRSQWRKLELALKFINKSKNCAKKKRLSKNESSFKEIPEGEEINIKTHEKIETIESAEYLRSDDILTEDHGKWTTFINNFQHILYDNLNIFNVNMCITFLQNIALRV